MIDEVQIKNLKELMEEVLSSYTKENAKSAIRKLESQANFLSEKLTPYARGKLREVISSCKAGAGQVKDKDHWISCAERSWYVFERESRSDSKTEI